MAIIFGAGDGCEKVYYMGDVCYQQKFNIRKAKCTLITKCLKYKFA